MSGCMLKARFHKKCSVTFPNGDKFVGMFRDGIPNGPGEMLYKNTVPSTTPGVEYEVAQYKGQFRNGKREGKGKMVWADGTVFDGLWQNDERLRG